MDAVLGVLAPHRLLGAFHEESLGADTVVLTLLTAVVVVLVSSLDVRVSAHRAPVSTVVSVAGDSLVLSIISDACAASKARGRIGAGAVTCLVLLSTSAQDGALSGALPRLPVLPASVDGTRLGVTADGERHGSLAGTPIAPIVRTRVGARARLGDGQTSGSALLVADCAGLLSPVGPASVHAVTVGCVRTPAPSPVATASVTCVSALGSLGSGDDQSHQS